MLRDSKKQKSEDATTNATLSNQDNDKIRTDSVEAKKATSNRRRNIMIGTIIYILAALCIASHYCTSSYDESLPLRFKQYGSTDKPCVVLIPGLDGATSFFNVRLNSIKCLTDRANCAEICIWTTEQIEPNNTQCIEVDNFEKTKL